MAPSDQPTDETEETGAPGEDTAPDDDAVAAEWEAMAEADAAAESGADGEGGGGDGGDGDGGDGEGGGGDDDAVMAEWEAMAEDGGGETARVLNQDEIDSLLGFQDGAGGDGEAEGIRAILDSSMVSYERLPMLEVVFDRLVRMMSTSMRNFTQDNVEVSLDNITSVRFGDYLNSIPLPAILGVYKAEEWDNYGLLTVDSALIYSIVDVLLGGRRGTAAMRIEGRPYTTIERNLVERMVYLVLQDLSAAFDPICSVTYRYERLETNPRFATIARPGNAAVLAKLRVDMEDRGGRLELLLPYATLEPAREVLLQMFMGEKFGRDTIWESHLAGELWSTEVEVRAVLDEVTHNLGDVMDWRVGSQILLNATPDAKVSLRCGNIEMFEGTMGRRGGNIAVRIDERKQRELESF